MERSYEREIGVWKWALGRSGAGEGLISGGNLGARGVCHLSKLCMHEDCDAQFISVLQLFIFISLYIFEVLCT